MSHAQGGQIPDHSGSPADDRLPVRLSGPEAWMSQATYDQLRRDGVVFHRDATIHIVPDDESPHRAAHRDMYGTDLDRGAPINQEQR